MMTVDLTRLVKPPTYETNTYGDAQSWQAWTQYGRFIYGVDFAGKFYTYTPEGETDHPSLQAAHDFVHSAYSACVLAVLNRDALTALLAERDALKDRAEKTEDALKHYKEMLCEGFCGEDTWADEGHSHPEIQRDCGGCLAASVLLQRAMPKAKGEK